MEADEGAAADRDARRGAGHHVVVAGAVVALVVADRADDRQLVGDGRQARQVLREVDAGNLRVDRRELAAEFLRRVRLGIEGFVVGGAAVQPDQDAAVRLAVESARTGAGTAAAERGQAAAEDAAQTELKTVAASDAVAIRDASSIDSPRSLRARGVNRLDSSLPGTIGLRLPA